VRAAVRTVFFPLLLLAADALALDAQTPAPGAGPGLLDRLARLEVRQVRLQAALLELSRRSGVPIAFSPALLPGNRMVGCSCGSVSVRQALDTLLLGTGLRYHETPQRVVVASPAAAPGVPARPRAPQVGVLLGVVQSASDSQPVTGAQVRVVGAPGEVRSDAQGRFRLGLRGGDEYRLLVRAMGFAPREVRGPGLEPGDSAAAVVLLEPAGITLAEVVVTPSSYAILDPDVGGSHQSLTREEVDEQPHLGEDVYRAIGRLPGIVAHDITVRPTIRGSQAEEVLQTLDGIELHEPYHLKDIGGALSVVDVEAIAGVDLSTGGFTAEYGDALAGVLAMRSATPPPGRSSTTLGASLMYLTFLSQGGFAGGRGTWLTSARRGYMDIVLKLMGETEQISPRYYDAFGKVQYQLGASHLISGHLLHAGDSFSMTEDDHTEVDSRWGSSYAWLSWRAAVTGGLSVETIASASRVTRHRSGSDLYGERGFQDLAVEDHAAFESYGLKQDWSLLVSERLLSRWGVELKSASASYDYYRWRRELVANFTDFAAPAWSWRNDSLAVLTRPSGGEIGAYLTSRLRLAGRLTAEFGARFDRQSYTGESAVSPRANAALDLAPRTTVRAAWGFYRQAQDLRRLDVAFGDTIFDPAQRAEHRIVGLSHVLGNGADVRIEAYERRVARPWPEYRDLVPNLTDVVQEEYASEVVRLAPTRRVARGVEVLVRRPAGEHLAWSASFAISSASDLIGGVWVPAERDQQHTIRLDAAYAPSPRWSFAASWNYHSGWPYTEALFRLRRLVNGDLAADRYWGPLNAERLPSYHRLDVRVMRRFPVRRGALSVFLDVFNLYGRRNAESYKVNVWVADGRLQTFRHIVEMIGVLPNIGVRWEF